MDSTGPVRDQGDLAEMVELLLEKGVVINADVVVSVGDTELLGVELRAALASFETAAKYGLEFPDGTDRERVIEAANLSDEEVDAVAGEEGTGETGDASSSRGRSLRLRPGGPAGSGDGEGDTADPASAADKGASEAARKTPAGAGDVTIDPAPYEPSREDRDPDVDEPGVDHPEVDTDDEAGGDQADGEATDGEATDDEATDDEGDTDEPDGDEDASGSSDADASGSTDETSPESDGDGDGGDGE